MSSTTYTLSVQFDDQQSQQLNQANYQLCISQCVNNDYNVVWASQAISNDVVFEWTDEFQIFGAGQFQPGQVIEEITIPTKIAIGQVGTMDSRGFVTVINDADLGSAMGNLDSAIAVLHQFISINIGVMQRLGGKHQPIYLNKTTDDGANVFRPKNTISVFLSQSLKSGMMYAETGSPVYTVSFDNDVAQVLAYVTGANEQSGTFTPVELPPT